MVIEGHIMNIYQNVKNMHNSWSYSDGTNTVHVHGNRHFSNKQMNWKINEQSMIKEMIKVNEERDMKREASVTFSELKKSVPSLGSML